MSFGTIVRLVAIALGIMSAVLIARDGFKIPLNEYLDAILTIYDNALAQIAVIVFEPAIKALFAKLREWFAIDLHLLSHWKHVFVLMWLTFGSLARAFTSESENGRASTFIWGALCALATGTFVGIVPLGETLPFWWPIAVLAYGGGMFWGALLPDRASDAASLIPPLVVEAVAVALLLGIVANVIALEISGLPIWNLLGINDASHLGLVFAIVGTGFIGAYFILTGRNDQSRRRTGLDILAVLGGAAFIVWLGNALA